MTLKQIFVINSDIKMSAGKIAVQVAHGEVYYMNCVVKLPVETNSYRQFDKWIREDNCLMKKIVLKASEEQINKLTGQLLLEHIWYHTVRDRGLTEVPPDSLTCLVVEPLTDEKCKELFGHLKLL